MKATPDRGNTHPSKSTRMVSWELSGGEFSIRVDRTDGTRSSVEIFPMSHPV